MKERNMSRKKLPGRGADTNVPLMDVQIIPSKEECALGMEQRSTRKNAAAKDAQISSSIEVFV
eukprot:scaffold7856_cov72-Skeletonema_dohrnii-CCMP3373.AAC.2